jgi:hypothetical protein
MGPVGYGYCHRFKSYLKFLFPLLLVLLANSAFARPVKVVESDSRHLSLSLEELSIQWQEIQLRDGAVVLFDPSAKGMGTSGVPGGVRSPSIGGWLLVPPGTSPRINSRQENWTSAGNRALMVQAIPVLTQGENSDFVSMSEILVLPGDDIPADAPIPGRVRAELGTRNKTYSGSALVLGEIKWWRGHRIVSWSLNAIRHDGRLAREVLKGGSWDIVFETDKAGSTLLPAGHDSKSRNLNDKRFSGFLLNENLIHNTPTEAGYHGTPEPAETKGLHQGGKNGTLLGSVEGRLAVQETRLYRVTSERLRSLGYLPDLDVDESQIRLYQRRYLERLDDGSGEAPYVEVEVPIRMVGEGDVFNGDDYFVFHGLRLRDDVDFFADVGQGEEAISGCGDNKEMNNPVNFYWVAASEPDEGHSWARMAVQSIAAAAGPPEPKYRRVEHHEEQVAYRKLPVDIDEDRLFLNHYLSTQVSVPFSPLWSPDLGGDPVTLDFQIAGRSSNSPDELLELKIVTDNTLITPLAPCLVDTNLLVEKHYSFSPNALAGNSSMMVLDHGGSKLYSWLNWAIFSYDALYEAVGNSLTFHGGQPSGGRSIEVTGFSTSDIALIEITDPRNPVFFSLGAGNILADSDGWKISIEAVQDNGTRSFVAMGDFGGLGVGEFYYYKSSMAADQVSPVDVGAVNPDLLVITHPDFTIAAERWITHRQARSGGNLNVHMVEVQDIYDWYSGGLKDPWALKRLANHAISEWGTWSLMLIGDANENSLELGVSSAARDWSKDWVPTHYHVQDTGYQAYAPEVLASDKWYATFESGMNYPVEDFPTNVVAPWQMYVGRFPCNSVDELNTMIDKVILVETPLEGQDWRKRMIFFADDHWSNGYAGEQTSLFLKSIERGFADVERDIMAPLWKVGTPVTLEVDTLFLDNFLKPIWIEEGSEQPRSAARYQRAITESNALTDLLTTLSAGGLMAHYQGHANSYLLCSEYWFQDLNRSGFRQDLQSLTNADSPWVFFGMGCHVSDWAQDTVTDYHPVESSLGEKFLTHIGGGASATYGSSGYEYVDTNEMFGKYIMERWIDLPPNSASTPAGAPSGVGRSRWMLGELLLCCEADVYPAHSGHRYREMVAQFTLLGDPLMMLDAGPPVVSAVLRDDPEQEISGEIDLVSTDDANLQIIDIDARDEAGIDRMLVVDSTGADLTSSIVTESIPDGEDDHQQVNYRLDVPIRPFDHQIRIEVFDTGANLANDRHYTLLLNIAQEAVFTVDGEEHDPNAYEFATDEPVDFQCEMTSGAWLDDSTVYDLQGENLEVDNFVIAGDKSNGMSFSFTATATAGRGEDRAVILIINGFETTYVLESDGAVLPDASISQVINYPNPMRSETRFLYETTASSGEGKVRVFAVSGRTVANIPFTYSGGHEGVIEWNGQDDDGDSLANGTYLYRLEMNTPSGMLVSPMQRLVVMN